MKGRQIVLGYLSQIVKGCDAIECDNEYCKSCPKFKYFNIKDEKELQKKAIELSRNHSSENHLCKNLSPIQYDKDFLSKIKYPNFTDFKNNTSDISNILLNEFKDQYNYSYAFFETQDDRNNLIEDKLYFDDERLELFAQNFEKNRQSFVEFSSIVIMHVNEVCNIFGVGNDQNENNKTSVPIQYHHIRMIYLNLFFLSLFPANDVNPHFSKTLKCIYKTSVLKQMVGYLKTIFSNTPKVFQHVLTYTQDNITMASILNDKFSFSGEIEEEIEENTEAIAPEIRNMAMFIDLLRRSNTSLPTRVFVNEVFTDNFIEKYKIDDLLRYLQGNFSYLTIPSILTLKSKSENLKRYFSLLQNRQRHLILLEDPFFSIVVHRDRLIEEAVQKVSNANPNDYLKTLRVKFVDEQGVDAGGVSREFFYLVCNEIFHIKYGMFQETPNGKYWFVSDAKSMSPPIYFNLMGTIIGLAIYNSTILPIRFPLLMYKKLWGQETTLDDYEEIDPEIVHSLKSLLNTKRENPDFDFSELDMMFYINQDVYGDMIDIPLCPDGLEKKVTSENLEEYVDLYSKWLLNDSVKIAFEKFQIGFNRVIDARTSALPYPLVVRKLIAYDEVDILVSGEEIIHWEALKQNCEYSDGYNKDSQPVVWFWEIFDEMTSDEKQQFFRFSTGSDRAPVGGLHLFKLTIQKVNDTNKLPVSHTCFNIFSLPNYTSKEEMRTKINLSLKYAEGFGLI